MSVLRRLCVAGCLLTLANPATAQRRTRPASPVPSPAFDTSLYNALEWREIGPFRGGRVTPGAGGPARPRAVSFWGAGGGGWETNPGGGDRETAAWQDLRAPSSRA